MVFHGCKKRINKHQKSEIIKESRHEKRDKKFCLWSTGKSFEDKLDSLHYIVKNNETLLCYLCKEEEKLRPSLLVLD